MMSGDTGRENNENSIVDPCTFRVCRTGRVVLASSVALLVWPYHGWSIRRIDLVFLPGTYRTVRLLTIDRPFPAEGRFAGDPYVGSRACAECHPAEAALHSRSGHARTLWPAGRRVVSARLAGTTVPDPEVPGVSWSYQYRDRQLHITAAGTEQGRGMYR